MPQQLLTKDEVQAELSTVAWQLEGSQIAKNLVLTDFNEAMAFVNDVAALAEARSHHPDISISWNKVGLTLSTHSAGGLTAADFDLARAIDALLE